MLSVYGENSQNTMEWKKAQDTHKNLNKKTYRIKKDACQEKNWGENWSTSQ